MKVSTVAPPPPLAVPQPSPPKTPDPTVDNNAAQPKSSAPLPPGQGTRVDQLV